MKKRGLAVIIPAICLVAATIAGQNSQASSDPQTVFADPESLVRGLYKAVSFDPGPAPDWEFVKSFFLPQAVLVVRKTRTSMAVMNVREFVDWFIEDVEKHKMTERGFEETVERLKLTAMGDIAHAFVVYRARLKTPAGSQGNFGLDSWTLMKKDGRWWIASCANEVPTAQRPIPADIR